MKLNNMKSVRFVAAALLISSAAGAVHATEAEEFRAASASASAPSVLGSSDKQKFAAIYRAIKAKQWGEAASLIDKAPNGPMAQMARAELYLAPGSPRVEGDIIKSLLESAPYLPQFDSLQALAKKRGFGETLERPDIRKLAYLGGAPKRDMPQSLKGTALRDQLQTFIKNDDPASAEALLAGKSGQLGSDELNELSYRIAWSYYIENDDANARRLAATVRNVGGEWGTNANWAYGLASWRLKDFNAAFDGFDRVARDSDNDEMRAAGLFWSSRAAMASKQPGQVQGRLQSAARLPETFYGLLASESLGMEPLAKREARISKLDWNKLKSQQNVQIAVGLAEIGESSLADTVLRYQAKIGDPSEHGDLAQLAGSLNLASTQFYMSHYGPARENMSAMARYPMPTWTPTGGWRVDPSLVFAHALQESNFRTDVVSSAGARGLMQVRTGTAQDMARERGTSITATDLNIPTVNLEYGQSYMEKLRDMNATGGLLPKVIAAYNAGPAPVTRWNTEIRDGGDPLLYIESIPYWETRGYVSIILRNYWIYEMRANKASGSMNGLAQYLWPRFPDKNGSVAVKRGSSGGFANAAR